jgi:hypothetical protein
MMADGGDVKIRSLKGPGAGELVVKVSVTREFRVRLRVGLWLIRLGAWVLPITSRVETTKGE